MVAQCVQLSRVSSDPQIWKSALDSVIPAVSLLKGEDIASILKATARAGIRNETLLAAVCESLKTLPVLRVVRIRDISSILSSFFRLNFAPSVESLNAMAAEVLRSVDLYRTRNQDICLMYRYFSILRNHPTLVINYESDFRYPQLCEKLERMIGDRIGSFGPVELCVVAKYADRISLERLMINFSRLTHVRPVVRQTFLTQLDRRFGKDSWKHFEHLIVHDEDSTGWARPVVDDQKPDDIFTETDLSFVERKPRLPLFQLQDELVAQALESVRGKPRTSRVAKTLKKSPGDEPLSDDQLEFLRMLEEELAADPAETRTEKAPTPFEDTVERKLIRSIELSDIWRKPLAPELQSMRRLKAFRRRRLGKFTQLGFHS